MVGQHVHVGTIRDSENVGWDFITSSTLVDLDYTSGVDGVTLVWVDGNAEKTGVGVDEFHDVTGFQVVQDGSIVKVGQVGHVLAFLEFWGVNLCNQVLLEVLGFTAWDANGDEVALSALDLTEEETFLVIGNPARFLGIVGLSLIDTLLFKRNVQEFCWIWVGTRTFDYVTRHVVLLCFYFLID
jgi:hypothetical protein